MVNYSNKLPAISLQPSAQTIMPMVNQILDAGCSQNAFQGTRCKEEKKLIAVC